MSPVRPLVLLVPSRAAAVELPRRLASTGVALAAVYPMKPFELARALAEPLLLGRGLRAWDAGHDALLAARLLAGDAGAELRLPQDVPLRRVSAALARTLSTLRGARVGPEALVALAASEARGPEDARRLRALGALLAGFEAALDAAADPLRIFDVAREALPRARWLDEADLIACDDLELEPAEEEFVEALAARLRLRVLARALPSGLRVGAMRCRLSARGVREVAWADSPLAPIAPPEPPPALQRLREALFEPPAGEPARDDSVELLTAPGEASEARTIVRRLLREAARGVPFEEMGVILPRPESYASLFADLLSRLGIPYRLHPSLPLRLGRSARALLLLFRCRGLERPAVMEFLTFAPVPFEAMLGAERRVVPARWDQLSREAGIVSGLSRWIVGLRAWGAAELDAADRERDDERRERRRRNAADAEALLHVVEILSATLEGLAGEASWPEWVERLEVVCDQWIGADADREAVLEVIADLGSLAAVGARAPWAEVESVLEARFEWERLPLEPEPRGAVHVGALDAMAGLPFRVVAIPGLVEGGYPGVFRPDPFLLDGEREALDAGGARLRETAPAQATAAQRRPLPVSETAAPRAAARAAATMRRARVAPAQLALFSEPAGVEEAPQQAGAPEAVALHGTGAPRRLPTTQDRLHEARRLFHRAVSQASERLLLSYPRADPRSGRERLPSLFFAAAASTLAGRALAAAELERLVAEDALDRLPLEETLDAGERDRVRLLQQDQAAAAIAAGSPFFRQSRFAVQARWSSRLTRHDGHVGELDAELRAKLDPLQARGAVSASRLAGYARCGFRYLLENVLHLQPAPEPEERRRLQPLERGDLFHRVAERFLRERRQRGELPLSDTKALRERLREMAQEALDSLVAAGPPRFTLLWEREQVRFHECVDKWFTREVGQATRWRPLHLELSFGLGCEPDAEEPHDPEPLSIDLGEGGVLRVCGRIDRIDRSSAGGLVLRDYKTGQAPKDDGGVFRGGRQLQIPFYVLAAAKLFPQEPVVEAFLDYVDAGRPVAFRPELARGESFRGLLRDLVGLIAEGAFVQDPAACDFCDFTAVCGPRGLLQRRQAIKQRDPLVRRYLRLRDVS